MFDHQKHKAPRGGGASLKTQTNGRGLRKKYTRQSLVAQAGSAICQRVLTGMIDSAQARRENAAFVAAVDVLVHLRDRVVPEA
jgi:hypothetical protein